MRLKSLLMLLPIVGLSLWNAAAVAQNLASIPGIVAYSRPSQLGLADGAVVTVDTDFAGAYNGTPVGSPTYDSAKKAIRFNGTTQYITNDQIGKDVFNGTNRPFSILGLYQISNVGPTQNGQPFAIAANVSGGTSTPTRDFYSRYASDEMVHSDNRADDNTEYISGACVQDLNMHVCGWGFDGTYIYLWLDGTLVSKQRGDVGTLSLATNGGFTEGAHRRVEGITSFLNGWRGERGIWNRYLTPSEWASGTAYLQGLVTTASAPSFDPQQMTGAGSNWRSDSMTPTAGGAYADGDSITNWSARGFNTGTNLGGDLTSANGGTAAVFAANVQGGKPMINCTGGRYLLPTGGTNLGGFFTQGGTPTFSCYGAFKPNPNGSEQDFFVVSAANGAYLRLSVNAAGAYQAKQKNNAGTVTAATGGTANTNFHLWQFVFDGSLATLWIDGVKVINAVALSGGVQNINYHMSGSGGYVPPANQNPWYGYLGEVGEFPTTVLTGPQIAQVLAYQRRWWGIPTTTQRRLPTSPRAGTRTIGRVGGRSIIGGGRCFAH